MNEERNLRTATGVFVVALLVHGADHIRRGLGLLTPEVFWAGTAQFLLALITATLVYRRHRLAAAAAVVIGFASAVGFIGAHLLPHWSAFSDAFPGAADNAKVTVFSWATAVFEIAADLALGWTGLVVLRLNPRPS